MNFQKGYPVPLSYPLTEIPPSEVEVNGETKYSTIVSPRIGNDHGLPAPPAYGSGDLYDLLAEVMEVRRQVQLEQWPADFLQRWHPEPDRFRPELLPQPLRTEGLNIRYPSGCANVVHMDNPMDMPNAVLSWLNAENVPLKSQTGHTDFLEAVPRVVADLASAINANLEAVFEAKYYFGLIRPEELLNLVYQSRAIEFDCRSMTAYPEGCPSHCSFPAGHAGAASAVKVFGDHFELSEFYQDTIFDCAYLWAQFRTFAGVHYAIDNLAGLEIGGLTEWNEAERQWDRAW